jgi:DNA gyrase/topoisomerase IV subunit A
VTTEKNLEKFVNAIEFAFSPENDPDEDEYISDGHDEDEPIVENYPPNFLNQLTVRQLKELAKEKGLPGYSKIRSEQKTEGLRKALKPLLA